MKKKHRPLYSGRYHLPVSGGLCLSCSGTQTPFPQSLRHAAKPLYPSFGSRLCISVHKYQNYWLIIAGCGIAAALIIQFAVIGHGAGLYTIAVRALAFVTVVYLLNLVKVIFAK